MDLSRSWAYIEQVANHRLENNKTERHVAEYGTYIEVIGAAGELAARRFLGLSEELHEHFDGGTDLFYKDIRVDVKATVWTTKIARRYLQYPIWKPVRADVVLLTAINIDRRSALILGYARPDDLKRAPVNNTRDYPCVEIPIPKLRKASWLLLAESLDDLYPGTKTQTHHQHRYYQAGARA
jgi:hypothetical protein